MLRKSGCSVALLDCLDQTWRDVPWPEPNGFGQGKLPKTEVPRPASLSQIPRRYSRYGLPVSAVSQALAALDPPPDMVLLTSLMTYWYPGAVAAAEIVRTLWPRVPIVLGGVYATACPDHAERFGIFDLVVQGPLENEINWRALWQTLGLDPPELPEDAGFSFLRQAYPAPAYSFLLCSRGCPFDCSYCASRSLYSGYHRQEPEAVLEEVACEKYQGVRDVAFFDDALLLTGHDWLESFFGSLAGAWPSLRLHTPNAMHVKALDLETCRLLKAAGLRTVRLGLETADFQSRHDSKLTLEQWQRGLANLRAAGFVPEDIAAYILFGLPGQEPKDVEEAIAFARSFGIKASLAHYSPIPGSRLFQEAEAVSPYPLQEEPLFQNNSIWPCFPGGFSWEVRHHFQSLLT